MIKAKQNKQNTVEERRILLDGVSVPFLFSRKSVRNLNARIRSDGRLCVSAPYACSEREIIRFLQANAARLVSAWRRAGVRRARLSFAFGNGETIPLLGKMYTLVLEEATHASVTLGEENLTVAYPRAIGERGARALLSAWLSKRAKAEINDICQEIYYEYFSLLFPYPTVRFRKMTASFGNCRKDTATLTFNLRLVYAPRDAIAYVVMHELVHMLHPDHSKRFYAALSLHMPDHRERKAGLSDIPLHTDPFL